MRTSQAVMTRAGNSSSPVFNFTISTNQQNVNLRTLAVAAGWDGVLPVRATIAPGVVIGSASTGSYAMTVDGSFPAGVSLSNNGVITGRGGNGGAGNSGVGAAGGPALLVSVPLAIDNTNGRIAGGGGGGGGGGYDYKVLTGTVDSDGTYYDVGGGGGGGQGNLNSSGGASGGTSSWYSTGTASPGSGGSTAGPGAGGPSNGYGGNGGAGGAYGSAGATGGNASAPVADSYVPGGAGGAPGNAVVGNANITWVSTGTRNGGIVN